VFWLRSSKRKKLLPRLQRSEALVALEAPASIVIILLGTP
jgi:hypothetical protein